MSAVAYVAGLDKIHLGSDGFVTKAGECVSVDTSKIYLITQKVALLWMGRYHELRPEIRERCKNRGATTPGEIGQIVEETIVLETQNDALYNVTIVGFNKRELQLWATDATYPLKQLKINPGSCGSLCVDRNESAFKEKLKKYFPGLKDHPNGLSLTFKRAFEEAIKAHPTYGERVGGNFFYETLKASSSDDFIETSSLRKQI